MNSAQNTAQILDFSTFKRQRQQAEPVEAQAAEPAVQAEEKTEAAPVVWYPCPVWVWLPPFYALMSR